MSYSFYTELKRRNVFKVVIGYILLGWVVLQVADVLVPALSLPEWTIKFLLATGLLGFPFAAFFAWVYELTPEGLKKETEITTEESITSHTGQKLNYIIIALLAFSLVYFIYESRFQTQSSQVVEITPETVKDVDEPKKTYSGTSIAVMPFVNMSSDPEQEYFSDGISEEILNVLAKIPNLQVTSRSSTFAFKGDKINIADVAKKLGVRNVLEGSVRKSGNRIRITAQLIEADTDTHLWSETYDRELNDIFVIQDEISNAIVVALKDKLGINTIAQKKADGEINLDAHNEYLQGRFFIEKRTPETIAKALSHFNNAIAIDPNYAPAWMGKAWATLFSSEFNYGSMSASTAKELALPAIDEALSLDPLLPESHAIKGLIIDSDGIVSEKAIPYFQRALELNPNYSDAITWYAGELLNEPMLRMELREKAVRLNPMSILSNINYAYSLLDFERYDEAEEIAEHLRSINPKSPRVYAVYANIYLTKGELGKASYYNLQRSKTSNSLGDSVVLAFSLYRIGLPELAKEHLVSEEHKQVNYLLTGNHEGYISGVRTVFPRGEKDTLGYYLLAEAEMLEENYAKAVKFLEKSFCTQCDYIVYAYQQMNDLESANVIIEKRKQDLKNRKEKGAAIDDIAFASITFLENDIDASIIYIEQAIRKGHLLNYEFVMPMYNALREHPGWEMIDKLNKAGQKEQSAIYLQLVKENPEGN